MKSQKIWVFILPVVLIAGGAYWYGTQNTSLSEPIATTEQPTQEQTTGTKPKATVPLSSQTTQTSLTPSATIDASSLTSAVATPTLAGTVSGTSAICIEIGKEPMPKNAGDAQGIKILPSSVFQSCGPHDSNFLIANGRWFMGTAVNVPNIFVNGAYTVGVYDDTPGSDFGNLLTSGTLTVAIPVPSINTYSSSQYGFTIQYPSNIQPSASGSTFSFAITVPSTYEGPETVSVSVQSTNASCLSAPSSYGDNGATDNGYVTINGIQFKSYSRASAATGSYINDTTYAAVHNNLCYTIEDHLQSYSGGYFGGGQAEATQSQSDLTFLKAAAASAVQSFRFN